jgi:hypothetical protein
VVIQGDGEAVGGCEGFRHQVQITNWFLCWRVGSFDSVN